MQIKQKILNSLNKWRLDPKEWTKKWHKYNLSIQELVWARNLVDWYNIDIYDLEKYHLESVTIEIRPVIEFWCVHNKMFLRNT